MKKTYKSLSALALAGTMIFATGISTFAAEEAQTGTTGANTAVLKKVIEVINHDGYAYEPEITYTYLLESGTAAGTVTDDNNLTVNYKAGDVSYLAAGDSAEKTAEFHSADAVSGDTSSRDITWTFDPEAFPSAGVYRYTITETTSVNPADIGIDRADAYDTEKFLDVYVQNGAEGQEIYGLIVVDDEEQAVDEDSAKSEGWKVGDDLETYETYNLTVTKQITGAGADMKARFPFTISLQGKMDNANIATEGTGENISEFGLDADGNAAVTGLLGNETDIVIKGLPKTVTFSVSEENQTGETYQATAEATNLTGAQLVSGSDLEGNAQLDVLTDGAVANAEGGAITVTVTNSLEAISPTGVVLRYAPYILILAAGIVIFLVSRKRREKED